MPFTKVQGVLNRILPDRVFGHLYNVACNCWDVYQKAYDTVFYLFPLVYYWLIGNVNEVRKTMIVQSVLPYTMCSRIGLATTYDVAKNIVNQRVRGSFVECGIARGGCSALLALVAQDENGSRKTWLFDSFEGLPKQSSLDGEQKPVRHKDKTGNDLAEGYCLGTYEEVENLLFNKLRLNEDNIYMVKGWFQNTLPSARWAIGDIAVLRLDGDWYESTKCCLENLYGNVVVGGYVIIDDYPLKGCMVAVDEFREKQGINAELEFDANGRAYWRK